ncbi:TcdA/TcdB catalytic glycosyltransferase domain-containing protein [Plantactinospora sp. B24E8]|uniref:TcdA/TcdB catalytic glycosyltransferase domain-containing protein n=1 Tax=Plantactinospora sp. B24E8 TaxID=3153567 RepID=UPI00325EC83C
MSEGTLAPPPPSGSGSPSATGGPAGPQRLSNRWGRTVGLSFGGSDNDLADLVARWIADCDRAYARHHEAPSDGTARFRDLTVPWVAETRTFAVVSPPAVDGATLARLVADEGSFAGEYADPDLPVRSIAVIGGTVGADFGTALRARGFDVTVYTSSTTSGVVPQGTDDTYPRGGFVVEAGGHLTVFGSGLTRSQADITTRELVEAHRLGWRYAGTPTADGRPVPLLDRVGTLDLVDRVHTAARDQLAQDPTRLDLAGLTGLAGRHEQPDIVVRVVVERLRAASLLDRVRAVTDLVRDEDGRWRAAPVPPHVRRTYTAVGHHDADGTRPVRFGSGLPLRSDDATRPPARLTVPVGDPPADPRSSVDLVATASWLAETTFDRSRSPGGQRPPVVRTSGATARPVVLTRESLRALVAENLRVLGLGPEETERLTGRVVAGAAYGGSTPGGRDGAGPDGQTLVEVSEENVPPVTGFGRWAPAADPPPGVAPEQLALALFRTAVRGELTARGLLPTPTGADPRVADRVRAEAVRAHRLEPVDRLLLTETVRASGSDIAAEHAALLAVESVAATAPPPGHALAVSELRSVVNTLPATPDGVPTPADHLAAVAGLAAALHGTDSVDGLAAPTDSDSVAGLAAPGDSPAGTGGWAPVASLAGLAHEVNRPSRLDPLDASTATGPRLALVLLRMPDGQDDQALALVATTTGVRWVDPLRRRIHSVGELPAPVRDAVGASAVLVDVDGRIQPGGDNSWSTGTPAGSGPEPHEAAPPPGTAAPLGGGLLRLLDDLVDSSGPADRDALVAARQFGYEVAGHLLAARTGTTPPVGEIPAHAAADRSVATTVELMTLLHVQLSDVLADQANPGATVRSGTTLLARQPMLTQWEAAGPQLQDFLVQHAPVIRDLFAAGFTARFPDFAADLRAERGLPDDTELDLWTVPLLDARTGVPVTTAGQFVAELLHPDPTAPRITPRTLGLALSPGGADLDLTPATPEPEPEPDPDPLPSPDRDPAPAPTPAPAAVVPFPQSEADGDSLLLMMERLRPLREYAQRAAETESAPTVDLVVVAASGAADRVWVEVRVPGRVDPVSLGPDPTTSGLLDPTLRVAATIRVNPEQLTRAVLFSLEHSDLWVRSLRDGNSEFVRRFARTAVGHPITDAPMDATVGEFVTAMLGHSSRTWSDATDPVTTLERTDAAALASAASSLAGRTDRTRVDEARSWAAQQVALDHQRPLVTGYVGTTRRAQLDLLDSFTTLVAAEHVARGEGAARDLSQRLGRTYGTLRGFTLLPPPARRFDLSRPEPQEWVTRFVELARPLQEYAREEAGNPTADIELVLMAAPSRVLATDAAFSPGHAVVAIRLPNGRQVALGFYPDEGLFGAQGRINDDTRYLLARHARVLGVHHITAGQLADAYLFAVARSGENYHLLTSNCVVFATRLVGAALGRDVVDPTVTTPDNLIATLSPDSNWSWADSRSPDIVRLTPVHRDQLDAARRHLDLLGERTEAYGEALAWAGFQVAVDHQRPLVTHRPTPRQTSQFALLDAFTTMVAAEFHASGGTAAAALSRALGHAYGTLREPTSTGGAAAYEVEEPDLGSPRLPEDSPRLPEQSARLPEGGRPARATPPSGLALTPDVDEEPPAGEVLFSAGSDVFRSPLPTFGDRSRLTTGRAGPGEPVLPPANFGTDRRPTPAAALGGPAETVPAGPSPAETVPAETVPALGWGAAGPVLPTEDELTRALRKRSQERYEQLLAQARDLYPEGAGRSLRLELPGLRSTAYVLDRYGPDEAARVARWYATGESPPGTDTPRLPATPPVVDDEFLTRVNRWLTDHDHPPVDAAEATAHLTELRQQHPLPSNPVGLAEWTAHHIRTGTVPGLDGGSHDRSASLPAGMAWWSAPTPSGAGTTASGMAEDAGPPTVEQLTRFLVDRYRPNARGVGGPAGPAGDGTVGSIGPDYFGTRTSPEPPAFLWNYDFDALKSRQRAGFFRAISLTNGGTPRRADVDPRNLVADPDSVVGEPRIAGVRAGRITGRRIPRIVHAIWLGGPLTGEGQHAQSRHNLERVVEASGGYQVVLWTDVPRAQIERARGMHPPPRPGTVEANVLDMVNWAREHGIQLVNVDEVFAGPNAMSVEALYRSEMSRRTGAGYGTASDLLRIEILERFGGVYTDVDNQIQGPLDPMLEHVLGTPGGYGFARLITRVNNAVVVAAANTGLGRAYAASVSDNYTRPAGINNVLDPSREIPANVLALARQVHSHGYTQVRNEVIHRTGPSERVLGPMARQLRLDGRWQLPDLGDEDRFFSIGQEHTWLAAPTAPPPVVDAAATYARIADVASTLVAQLHNNPGNLNLSMVRPVVEQDANPAVVWDAVIEFIAGRRELRERITSVSDSFAGRQDPITRARQITPVVLPPRAAALLGQLVDAARDPLGRVSHERGDDRVRWVRLRDPSTATGLPPASVPTGQGRGGRSGTSRSGAGSSGAGSSGTGSSRSGSSRPNVGTSYRGPDPSRFDGSGSYWAGAAPESGPDQVVPSRFADDKTVGAAYPWLTAVNPDASVTNCVLTAMVTDMNLVPGEELVWQAPAEGIMPESHLVEYQRDRLGLPATDSIVYRTALEPVLTVMGAAEVGARGILLVRPPTPASAGTEGEAGAGVSHAFNLVRDAHGVVPLDGQRGGLARMPAEVGELFFLPLTPGINPPPGSTRVDPDQLTGGEAGLGGRETEVHSGYLTFPDNVDRRRLPWLARHPQTGIEVVLDRGTFRFLHNGQVWQDVPGLTEQQVRDTEILPIMEFVDTRPFRMLPGEMGMDRWDAAEALRQAINQIARSSRRLLAPNSREYSVRLTDLLRAVDGWTLHEQARHAHFVPVRPGNVPDLYAHMSFGARLRALRTIISGVAGMTWLENPRFDAEWAVEFAEEITSGLRQRAQLSPAEVRDIEGLLALAAMQVTGVILSTTARSAGKHHVALVARQPLWRIRQGLSPAASRVVHDYASWIRAVFEQRFGEQYPDFEQDHRTFTGRQGGPAIRPLSVAGAGSYLDNALLHTGAVRRSQGEMLGVNSQFDNLVDGLIVLEARALGLRFMDLGPLERTYSDLERIVRDAHVEAAGLPTASHGFPLGPVSPDGVPVGADGVPLPVVSRLEPGGNNVWYADGAEVLWRQVPEARDGWALLTDAELTQLAGRPLLEAGRGVPLLVHPAGQFVRVPVRQAEGAVREVLLTPEQLATMLAALLPAGADVTLLSCATGALPDGFARRLAQAGGWHVAAPVTDLFVSLSDERAELLTVGGESWLLFTPGSEPWDVVNDELPLPGGSGGHLTLRSPYDATVRHPFDGIGAVPSAGTPPTAAGSRTAGTPPTAAAPPSTEADLPETVRSLLNVARRLPEGAYRAGGQPLVDFLDARFMEIRHRGQPEMEGMAVADWFNEAVAGGTAGVLRTDSWRRVQVALEIANDSGFVVVLPDDTHPPSVLAHGEDGQLWQISFTPEGPVPVPLTMDGTPPPRQIMVFNRCSEVLLLPGG